MFVRITTNLERIERSFSKFHRVRALALIRITLGINALFFLYIQRIGQAQFLWGHDGSQPWALFRAYISAEDTFSLYALTPSDRIAALIFGLGALVTLCFTLGIFTRATTILFYVFTWSLYQRNPLLLTGGDNLLYLIAFFLIFADCGQVYSIDAAVGLRKWRKSRYLALLHGFAVIAIMLQICLLYFTSAFYKIQGFPWQSGTALYYILNVAEFHLDPWLRYVYDNAFLVTILTYGTFVFQCAFPFVVFNRTLKWFILPIALSFHLAIAYFMDLVSFSLVMISAELIFLSDYDYERIKTVTLGGWLHLHRVFPIRSRHRLPSERIFIRPLLKNLDSESF